MASKRRHTSWLYTYITIKISQFKRNFSEADKIDRCLFNTLMNYKSYYQ